jgi:hypothetical protein
MRQIVAYRRSALTLKKRVVDMFNHILCPCYELLPIKAGVIGI